ncbi:MAG: hypothetical protein JO219_08690 [Candidatus Eremiobacteraeota bacterium]|nr:hypothetical protein [Candidatus Eremiobacteraeota bacterium]
MRRDALCAFLVLAMVVVTAASARAAPTLQRAVGITSTPRTNPPPAYKDILDAIQLAHRSGVRAWVLEYDWNKLEPEPSKFALSDLVGSVEYFGDQQHDSVLVTIRTLDTTERKVPSDLGPAQFNDAQVRLRFHSLLDALRPHLAHIAYLSLGNEVDVYLTAHPDEWQSYTSFIQEAVTYVHAIMPGVKTGVTVTAGGLLGPNSAKVAALYRTADISIVTYYPSTGDFQFTKPTAPLSDFPAIVARSGDRPVVMAEVGFASSPRLGSSEAAQAEFVRNVYVAWAKTAPRMPFLNFFQMHDLVPDQCRMYSQYYGVPGDPNFIAWLCSLGLRNADGTPKAAWSAFVAGAKQISR